MLLHSTPFEAYNTTGSHNGGSWTRVAGATYSPVGSIQPAGDKELKVLPEGERSEGAVVLRVLEPMFMEDSKQGVVEIRQTFVLWNDETWRVKKLAHWSVHTGIYKYVAVKHLARKESGPIEY
jgi:hypothetical protein